MFSWCHCVPDIALPWAGVTLATQLLQPGSEKTLGQLPSEL